MNRLIACLAALGAGLTGYALGRRVTSQEMRVAGIQLAGIEAHMRNLEELDLGKLTTLWASASRASDREDGARDE